MAGLFRIETDRLQYTHTLDREPDATSHRMHAHDTPELLYFISGQATHLVESTVYPMTSGCTLIVRPGEVHKIEVDPSLPYERMVFSFQESLLTDSFGGDSLLALLNDRPLGSGNLYTPDEYDSDLMRRCLLRIETADDPAFTAAMILPAVMNELYGAYRRRQTLCPAEPPIVHTRMQEILAYLNDHILEELTLDDLCGRFFISKAQLGRLFRATTGSTPWNYILTKRLIETRRRILAGVPVTEAALDCGFRDYSAFYRAYVKRYGVSPIADRQAHDAE